MKVYISGIIETRKTGKKILTSLDILSSRAEFVSTKILKPALVLHVKSKKVFVVLRTWKCPYRVIEGQFSCEKL